MTIPLNAPLDSGTLAVATRGLTKSYRGKPALDGVDLTVPEGAAYVLAGPNGAGKTTMLKMFVDLVRPAAGTATVFGLSPFDDGAHVRSSLGYVPEQHDTGCSSLQVRQALDHHAAYYPTWDRNYAEALSQALELPLDERLGTQSKGMLRRIQLVQALAHRPRLLLLDEPLDGLDPLARDRVVSLLAEHMADSPTTLLISTHLVHEVEGLADCVGVLNKGRLAAQVRCTDLHQRLHRYLLEVPDGWSGAPGIAGPTLHREEGRRQAAWTVWGDAAETAAVFQASGATVRATEPLTLDRAVRLLLTLEVQ